MSQVELMTSPRTFSNTRKTLNGVNSNVRPSHPATAAINTVEQRVTKSAQKLLLSPAASKSSTKKSHRLQTYNSFKLGSNSAIKANPSKAQNKFELPMLNHRSNSKPNLAFNNTATTGKIREPQMAISKSVMSNMHQTQSHSNLPVKQVVNGAIQTLSGPTSGMYSKQNSGSLSSGKTQNVASMARLYQS